MADITEPKRISEQLALAHERFTTVLESLDAAVSVVAGPDGAELLFANRSYRDLYAADAAGHRRLQGALGRIDRGRGVRRRDAALVRRAHARSALGRRPRRAPADRHRHHGAQGHRGHRAPAAGEGAADVAPDDDGRDGLVARPRAEPAADGDQQLQPRHRVAHQGRRRVGRRRPAGAGEGRGPGAAGREHHSPHPRVREALRAAAPADPRGARRRGQHQLRRDRGGQARHRDPHAAAAEPCRRWTSIRS